ncbi:MAG: methyltransferase type 11 [Elusimicrobia bacterium CG1_02_63_36]|nr:MAG: methyltransferase type 11 [Elusimicrobia bacterium CG1_02_63_36]PIP83050.1 MAG: methyltransferase type 11 [Elusimicrobia bacterium CG22_combo_CG10-13_8_21_14_all_63_91]PJA14173.1 MAG: methyltransferase type 11 [Elusimicrobia bacterium CG_4_10_14_0_2_um_filter_63_34]PJB24431.1 MAG: methyltransferase type 11 [Elusimicrobia bacterium CG_4_9_14_3_um_filter_62_55]
MSSKVEEDVREYYGKTLASSTDLKTDACCDTAGTPDYIRKALGKVHDEVLSRYYGCGLIVPHDVDGLSVLDLGSGSGRDCYVLSQLVGPKGRVVGIDMTEEQLLVARKHLDHHAKTFGYARSNVEFKNGNIERLYEAGLSDASFDLIVSNCVINLAKNKESVLREAWRVLKIGGELYFSDVYADRRVPEELREDKVLYGECLSGALYWNDFLRLARKAGFSDPRLVESRPLELGNKDVRAKAGHIRFYSATYRLFKIPALEDACEDFGQAVVYKGTMTECPQYFDLDDHHRFLAGKAHEVCANTSLMLSESRFKRHFVFIGGTSVHYGIFKDCGLDVPFKKTVADADANAGCC